MPERTVFQSIPKRVILSLTAQASVWEAACAMTRANFSSVLVMEPPDKMLGIVTERDLTTRVLARALDPKQTTLAQIMTPNPLCVSPQTKVSDAVLLMTGHANGGKGHWETYLNKTYHSPQDDLSQKIDWNAGARYALLNYRIARAMADAPQRPMWLQGDYFGDLFDPGGPRAARP